MYTYDYIIIGAGFAGSVAARQLAEQANKKVLVIERRSHVGGNSYDFYDYSGILVHKYGPHIFHTNNEKVFSFLSRFTDWYNYQHKVVANIYGNLMPVPFNLNSLDLAFGKKKSLVLKEKLLKLNKDKITILELRQSNDPDIVAIADFIYNNIFKNYTLKQWGQKPEDIDPNTTARVPIFLSRDDRYFQDTYQGVPKNGYTPLFNNLLDHPNIELQLNSDALRRLTLKDGSTFFDGEKYKGNIIYTGAIDELFDLCYEALPYRTLDFKFESYKMNYFQTHGTVNYTVDQPFTRITEFKHLTGQQSNNTTIVREFSRSYTKKPGEIPYYAIINDTNISIYNKYKTLAENYNNLFLLGRLAEYKYYNMDIIVDKALKLCDDLI